MRPSQGELATTSGKTSCKRRSAVRITSLAVRDTPSMQFSVRFATPGSWRQVDCTVLHNRDTRTDAWLEKSFRGVDSLFRPCRACCRGWFEQMLIRVRRHRTRGLRTKLKSVAPRYAMNVLLPRCHGNFFRKIVGVAIPGGQKPQKLTPTPQEPAAIPVPTRRRQKQLRMAAQGNGSPRQKSNRRRDR